MRLIFVGLAAWSVLGAADAAPAEDAIAHLLNQGPAAPTPAPRPPPPANPVDPGPAGAPVSGHPAPIVMSARIGEHEDRTRLVIEFSDPVNIRTFTLANPDRVVVDLPEVSWRLGAPPKPSGNGAIRSYRYGLFRPGNSRMVIDLDRPVSVSDTLVLPPSAGFGYRVVIDLFPVARTKFDQASGWPADLKARETETEAAQLAAIIAKGTAATASSPSGAGARKIVVLDPGHGGIDSGTVGADGVMEKNIVLAEGLRLRDALAARGYIVHMTRDSDVFIPLAERVAIARSYHADLMISLHVNSNPTSSVDGLSIYTLSGGRSDREAAALARRENQSDIIAGVDLSSKNGPVVPILIDLAQRDTINKSSYFAQTALGSLAHVTDILSPNPHRSASLAVLVAPDVPAVLIELGFLSNRSDAAQMVTSAWRQRVAGAIADAVDSHFGRAPALAGGRNSP